MPSLTEEPGKKEQMSRSMHLLLRSGITIACILALFLLWTKLSPFFLSTYSFGPHGDCFLWNHGLVTLFAGSDSLIGLSYLFISGVIVYFVYKVHRDLPFSWVFIAFGVFIIACGSTHFLDVWTIWVPIYVFSGMLRFVTAIASVMTAAMLPFVLPNVFALIAEASVSEERKQQLERANCELVKRNSELLQQGSQLTTTNTALEEANRVRSQFLATMSHELRTPLTSIVGFSEMLLEDATLVGLNQKQRANLERILKNSEHLLDLINDVLDLSKIEEGSMFHTFPQVNVRELLVSVTDEIQSLAIARNLVLRVEPGEEIGDFRTHPTKLRQILVNLLSNALKFTMQGEVTLSAHPVFLRDKGTEGIAFVVQDTGIGIPLDIQAHIFEAFYQADMSYTRKVGGTGLGLSIAKQLTVYLGGTIEVKSIPGQGSTFTVKLPIKVVHSSIEQDLPRLHPVPQQDAHTISSLSHEPVPALVSEPLEHAISRDATGKQGAMILAVDDDPDTFVLIEAALRDTPYIVVGVYDPLAVMEQVQNLQPEAIILDVMMSKLNGWQLLRLLKETPATTSIPIVMLSVLPEQSTGYVLGADKYLVKPFKGEELCEVLQHVIEAKKYSLYKNTSGEDDEKFEEKVMYEKDDRRAETSHPDS